MTNRTNKSIRKSFVVLATLIIMAPLSEGGTWKTIPGTYGNKVQLHIPCNTSNPNRPRCWLRFFSKKNNKIMATYHYEASCRLRKYRILEGDVYNDRRLLNGTGLAPSSWQYWPVPGSIVRDVFSAVCAKKLTPRN